MTKQSYPSLFTMTTGFVCNFDCKPMSLVSGWHRQLVLYRDRFSNYLKQHDKKTLFLQTALFMVNMIKESKFNWCSSHKLCIMLSYYIFHEKKTLLIMATPYL